MNLSLNKNKDKKKNSAAKASTGRQMKKNIPGKDKAMAAVQTINAREMIDDLRGGRSVSLEFLKRHGWLLATLLIVLLSFMGLRYSTQTRMVEIQELTNELKRAESKKLTEKKEYMTLIRQTRMNELVKEHGLPLIHQEQPPYVIDDDMSDSQNNN